MKKVKIKIKGGVVNTDFSGFQGKACDHLAQLIHPEDIEELERQNKPEYEGQQNTQDQELIQ